MNSHYSWTVKNYCALFMDSQKSKKKKVKCKLIRITPRLRAVSFVLTVDYFSRIHGFLGSLSYCYLQSIQVNGTQVTIGEPARKPVNHDGECNGELN